MMEGNLSNCTDNYATRFAPPLRILVGLHFLLPVIIVGIVGNILTLLVLTRDGMKNTTNILLSTMTLGDLFYLLFSFPPELIVFERFRTSDNYMTFFIYTTMHLSTMSNLFATVSIW